LRGEGGRPNLLAKPFNETRQARHFFDEAADTSFI